MVFAFRKSVPPPLAPKVMKPMSEINVLLTIGCVIVSVAALWMLRPVREGNPFYV